MNQTTKILTIAMIALIIGLGIGYAIASNNYSNQIKGLEEGLETACNGLNTIGQSVNIMNYLTGVYVPSLDCDSVIEEWRSKY